MAFSRVSTGDSVIPSSCEMKYEPAFKPLPYNLLLVKSTKAHFYTSSYLKMGETTFENNAM